MREPKINLDRIIKILVLVIIITVAFPATGHSLHQGGGGSEAESEEECSTTCEISFSEAGRISPTPSPTPEPEPEPQSESEPEESILAESSEVEWKEEGWYFISLPKLPNEYTSPIEDEFCAPWEIAPNPGNCDLVYFYDSTEGSWIEWNESKQNNELKNIRGGRAYWVHVNDTGVTKPIEWTATQDNPIEDETWQHVTDGWYPRGWTAPHWEDGEYSEYNPMNISNAIPSVNSNWSLNISNVWRKEGYGTNVTSIEHYWPDSDVSNPKFTNDNDTNILNHGYWVCNNNQSELPTGYCSGSKPPRMPWQTDYFNVSSVTSSDIDKGDELKVNTTIENTAGEEATQNIRLVVPELDLRKIEENVTVGAGNSKDLTITTSTEAGEPGDYTAVVYTGNNETRHRGEDTFTISGSYFDVEITDTNSPIEEGETLEVNATVTNTGDQSGTQDIDLDTGGMTRDTTTETIDPGAERDVTLTWNTEEGDGGDYTAEVSSEDDTDATEVTVLGEPYFDVNIDNTNSPVQEGDTLSVDATITNTGDKSDTQDIELAIDGVTRDTTTETIDGNSEKSVTLSWNTQEGNAGDYTAEVSSEDDSDSSSVTVSELEDPYFEVNIDTTNSPVEEGETLTMDTTITNTGDQSDTQEIDLNINGSTKDSESLSLAASDSQAITLEWNTSTGDAGTYTAEVSSANETDSTGIEVDQEPVEEYTLQVTVDGEGSVDIDPEQATYEHGTEVTLTADPEDGWEFVEWTGDYESSQEEITVTMDEDKEITARFEEEGEGGEEAVPAADIALLLLGLSLAVMIYHVKKR